MGEIPRPLSGGDDRNIVVGRPNDALAGLLDFCEHGYAGEGRGISTSPAVVAIPFIQLVEGGSARLFAYARVPGSAQGAPCASTGYANAKRRAKTWREAGLSSMGISTPQTSEIAPNVHVRDSLKGSVRSGQTPT